MSGTSGVSGAAATPESLHQRGTLIVSLRRGNNLYNRHSVGLHKLNPV
jgi:hypothetical protein